MTGNLRPRLSPLKLVLEVNQWKPGVSWVPNRPPKVDCRLLMAPLGGGSKARHGLHTSGSRCRPRPMAQVSPRSICIFPNLRVPLGPKAVKRPPKTNRAPQKRDPSPEQASIAISPYWDWGALHNHRTWSQSFPHLLRGWPKKA